MNILLWIILTFLSLTISDGVKIKVDRNFNKDQDNDRFTVGSIPIWVYGCNMDGTHKCACYHKGTYTSDAGSQAKCYKQNYGVPTCQPVVSYRDGMQLRLQSGSSKVKQVLFWNLKSDGTENGDWKDFGRLFSLQYTIQKGKVLVVHNLPRPSFDGQLFKIIGSNGECFPIKVSGSTTYPFEFSTIFPSYITTPKPYSTIRTTITSTRIKTTLKPVNTSTTTVISTTPNNSFPTQSRRSKNGFSISNGIVIALVVVSVIAVGLSVTCLIICRKRRGSKEQKKKGSVKFDADKAIYQSPTENTLGSKCPQTLYNTHKQNIGNPMYIQRNANPYNFDNPNIYAHIEKPGNNFYEGIPYYQNDVVSPECSESYDYAKDTAPLRNENRKYEAVFEIHSDNITERGTSAVNSQSGYADLCEFRNTDNFYAGIDPESRLDESRTHSNIKSKSKIPKIRVTQPGYAPLDTSTMSRNVYAGINTSNGNKQNNYTTQPSEKVEAEYTTLEAGDGYTSLDGSKTAQEEYETLTEDEKKNGFTHSKYVGW